MRAANRITDPYSIERTPALIRREDPECYRLVLNLHGPWGSSQGENDMSLASGDMALYDSSRPFQIWRGGRGAPWQMVDCLTVTFPHSMLPIPPGRVRRLLGGRLTGRAGTGAVLSALVNSIASDADERPVSSLFHLSTAFADLLAALLSEELDIRGAMAPESAQRALLLRIQAYIEHRLADPGLSPQTLAAAHHLSVRSLHRLFTAYGLTPSSWIRERRLDHCRRDLAAPSLSSQPISSIAARWGFPDKAHFSRVFRNTYEMSPAEYRLAARAAISGDARDRTTRS